MLASGSNPFAVDSLTTQGTPVVEIEIADNDWMIAVAQNRGFFLECFASLRGQRFMGQLAPTSIGSVGWETAIQVVRPATPDRVRDRIASGRFSSRSAFVSADISDRLSMPHPFFDIPSRISFLMLLAAASLSAREVSEAVEVTYNRDIRPILSTKCFQCHGFDAESREAGLRLELEEASRGAITIPRAVRCGWPERASGRGSRTARPI